jgi:bacterioferritin
MRIDPRVHVEEEQMKGDPKVLEVLNEALTEELTAINQYFLHAEMQENFGFEALHRATMAESIDEMRHAEKLVERILFLDGQPNMTRYQQIKIGRTVEEMLTNDLNLEKGAVVLYNRAIQVSIGAQDNGTAEILKAILKDEERHVDFIETQLSLIGSLGLANYLTRQSAKAEG